MKNIENEKATRKYFYLTLFSGLLFLSSFYMSDFFLEKLWIFYLFPSLILGLTFATFFILCILNKSTKGLLVGIVIILTISTSVLLNSELFKSRKVLEATLMDDMSAIRLTLRENNSFEVNSSTLFTEETFYGNYQIVDNKIIFKDKRYNNDFFPDTVTIIDDKLILRFDKNGKPITGFATFFEINRNELNNVP